MKTLYLVRGLPGSGKTTLARELAPDSNYAADDYFETPGGRYVFDATRLGLAHAQCRQRVCGAMKGAYPIIAVHNTFTQAWEARDYFALAKTYDYPVLVIECQNDFGSTHGVPEATIQAMRERWEASITP